MSIEMFDEVWWNTATKVTSDFYIPSTNEWLIMGIGILCVCIFLKSYGDWINKMRWSR